MEKMQAKQINVARFNNGKLAVVDDLVAEETRIRIFTNRHPYDTLVCSPWQLDELVTGYMFLDGLINSYSDIKKLEVVNDSVNVNYVISPSADKKIKEVPLALHADDIVRLADELNHCSEIFEKTGGVHTAALSDGNSLITSTEDVSRHNALDRLVGRCLIQKIPMKNKVIVFSGRVPEEIISGIAYAGFSAVISVSAPTSRAVEIAEENNIMLICFARGSRFNVYTCKERLIIK